MISRLRQRFRDWCYAGNPNILPCGHHIDNSILFNNECDHCREYVEHILRGHRTITKTRIQPLLAVDDEMFTL